MQILLLMFSSWGNDWLLADTNLRSILNAPQHLKLLDGRDTPRHTLVSNCQLVFHAQDLSGENVRLLCLVN
jgi:hypothetical protein